MPIAFEQNQGQTDSSVKFISRGASGVLFLSPSEMTLRAPGKDSEFRLKLRGASATTSLVGTGQTSGTVNYFRGGQASDWLTNIPSYTQVTYKNVYPSIDMVVYGNNRQFESDFVLANGADPSAISMQIDGKLEIRQDGSLAVQSAGGAFQLHRPFVYQLASDGKRMAIDSHYTVDKNEVGFALGQYDHSKSLVIDPVLTYSTYLGGSNDEEILDISGDLLGNIYVTGQTTSINFPTSHPLQAQAAGGNDCFVTKFDPTGQHLIYSTYLGGSKEDRCTAIAVNLLGEAFVGGFTSSANFPTHNPIQASLKGTTAPINAFIAHLDCTGSKLVFSTYLGGGGEFLTGIAVDLLSNVYVTGVTNSVNFPVTKGAFQTTCGPNCYDNAFLSKLTPDGSRLVYSTYLGGSNYDSSNGIAVDLTGSVYLGGQATSPDFPTTKNAFQPKIAGPSNAFVTKFSPDGSSLVYSTFIGGSNYDGGRSIAVDLFGNAYLAGSTNSTNFPTVNAFQPQYKSTAGGNIFVLKLNNTGSSLGYSTYVGGSTTYPGAYQIDYPFGIAVDLVGNAYVVGETNSTDFPVKSAVQSAPAGGLDTFVVSFNTKGALNYSTFLGGTSDDYGFAVYSDLFGCVWVGGTTYSTNYPVTKAFQANSAGHSDAFLTRLNP